MKLRKLVSLLLCLGMIFSLAACGTPSTPDASTATEKPAGQAAEKPADKTTDAAATAEATLPPEKTPEPEKRQVIGDGKGVTLKLTFSGEEFVESALFAVLQEFFDETGISTEVIYVASEGGWSGYFSKIQTMIAANDVPDVIRIAIEGFRVFQDEGLILPIDDYLTKDPQAQEVFKDLHPNLLKPFTVDGKLYGLTFDWNNIVMHMNTDVFAEKEVPLPTGEWTLQEFRDIAKKLTYEKADGQKVFGFAIPNYYFAMSSWFYNNGGSVLNEDWTKCTLDSPEVIEVVQTFHDMIFVDGSAPQPPFDTSSAFMNGQVAMHCAGRWPLKGYEDSKFEAFDIQWLPKMKERKVISGMGIFPVLAASKHPEESFKLAVKLSSAGSQEKILQISHIPTSISVMDKILPNAKPKNSILFRESADVAVPVESPASYNEIQAALDRYMSLVFANEMAADEAMKQCAAEIDGILQTQ